MSEERPEGSRTGDEKETSKGAGVRESEELAPAQSSGVPGTEDSEGAVAGESAEAIENPAPIEGQGSEDPSPAADPGSPEELARALEEARREAREHMEMALRARAELDNVRKRAERDVANAHRYGLERFVNELLPVRDSLELGISAAGDDAGVAQVREGMELTLKLMTTAFDKLGIEVIDPSGEPFDPELHQAMSMREGEEGRSGSVLDVIQKGYRLNERLVRPALVVVAR